MKNEVTNQSVLPLPPTGVHMEWNWRGCP